MLLFGLSPEQDSTKLQISKTGHGSVRKRLKQTNKQARKSLPTLTALSGQANKVGANNKGFRTFLLLENGKKRKQGGAL